MQTLGNARDGGSGRFLTAAAPGRADRNPFRVASRRHRLGSTVAAALLALGAGGCDNTDSRSPVAAPGASESLKTHMLESGAALLQQKPPIDAINAYLDGFHFYNGRMQSQMEAHHYCSILNDDVIQCVIYDGNIAGAKIIGVEYIVSAKLFSGLPDSEKALWHSHVYEVKSGQLIAPGIPQLAEHELMEKLVNTYGKTWHTWHTDLGDDLPVGVPQLMMGFTADGQSDAAMVASRNERFKVDGAQRRQHRADIAAEPVDPKANGWQYGAVYQIPAPTL